MSPHRAPALLLLALLLPCAAGWTADLGDPMQPPTAAAEQTPNPSAPAAQLPLLRVTANGPRVLIGERWLGVGDTVDGARITAIRTTGIELRRNGIREEIPLLPAVRQPLPKR
jgi:hypothetical protein